MSMTRERFEAVIDQRLAAFKAKLFEQTAWPVVLIGGRLAKSGGFVVQAAGEGVTLEDALAIISELKDQIAKQLGMTPPV